MVILGKVIILKELIQGIKVEVRVNNREAASKDEVTEEIIRNGEGG